MMGIGWMSLGIIILTTLPGESSFTLHPTRVHHFITFMNPPNKAKLGEPPKRIARRDIKKRRVRDGSSRIINPKNRDADKIWENSEKIPLVRSRSIEAGTDYWMDEQELQMSLERDEAVSKRKALEGNIPTEKLRTEIVTPYKENWIGIISVGILILATIISQFPELLQTPIIAIPDL